MLGVQLAPQLRHGGLINARSLMEDNSTIASLRAEKFDLVLRDIIAWPTALLAQILQIPEIDVVPTGVLLPFFGPRYSIPNPIAYAPQMTSTLIPVLVGQLMVSHHPACEIVICVIREHLFKILPHMSMHENDSSGQLEKKIQQHHQYNQCNICKVSTLLAKYAAYLPLKAWPQQGLGSSSASADKHEIDGG